MDTNDYTWTVRVERVAAPASEAGRSYERRVYARNHSFSVGKQASLEPADSQPSAVEYLLGALGADVVSGFEAEAARRRVPIDGLEMRISGRLDNVLTHLGVIGEAGHPGFGSIEGTLYVTAGAEPDTLDAIWRVALERSPLVNTLSRAVQLSLDLRVMD
jgi:OsmC-like protein